MKTRAVLAVLAMVTAAGCAPDAEPLPTVTESPTVTAAPGVAEAEPAAEPTAEVTVVPADGEPSRRAPKGFPSAADTGVRAGTSL